MAEHSLPDISPEFVEGIYQTLMGMEVLLDKDPIRWGPKRLNAKFAMLRLHLSGIERIFLKLSEVLSKYKRFHRGQTTIFNLKKKDLLANDPETRAGRSVADREAVTGMKLKTEILEIDGLDSAIFDLETLIMAVKSKKADLKDTQNRLKDQLKVINEEIALGSSWGDVADVAEVDLKTGQVYADVEILENIDDLLSDMDGEIHLEYEDPKPTNGVDHEEEEEEEDVDEIEQHIRKLEDTSSSVAVDNFLDELTPTLFVTGAKSAPDDEIDLDSLLESFDG